MSDNDPVIAELEQALAEDEARRTATEKALADAIARIERLERWQADLERAANALPFH